MPRRIDGTYSSCDCDACMLPSSYYEDDSYEDDSYEDDNDNDGDDLIRSWDYKPTPEFHGVGPLFLGAELEVEITTYDRADSARIAQDRLGGLGYLKGDGSLDYGFEIVTHPMSYTYAMESFPWDMLPELRRSGATAAESAGLHVHVSRDGFTSPLHRYRWMKFIYRNENNVCRIARRRSSEWAPFRPDARRRIKDNAKWPNPYEDRYQAVNVQNTHTLELRIFRSTLRPERLQAALGFASASVEYTRGLTAHEITRNKGWEWPTFQTWVNDRTEYQPLAKEMERLCAS